MARKRTERSRDLAVLPCGNGRIGMAKCPGLASAGDPTGDLANLRDWGADAVVTFLDHGDLASVGLGDMGDVVERLGMEWHHVPVPDFGVPGPASEARWRYASIRLRRILAAGGAVALHCHGGTGRMGTFAARLLIDSGVDPGEAVERVRAARPGAIETPRQLELVLAQKPGGPLPAEPTLEERCLGSLVGGAVGDAFGYAVEFDSLETIRREHGPEGLRDPVHDSRGRLVVSDDTQMTMFTAEGLVRASEGTVKRGGVSTEGSVWRAYRRWLKTQGVEPTVPDSEGEPGWLLGERALHARRAPGNTCLDALRTASLEEHGYRARNQSKGCGGVMRVAPAGLLPASFDPADAFALGSDLAALTHGHPTGYLAAGALAAIVRLLLDGRDGYEEAATRSLDLLAPREGGEETARAIERALELARNPATEPSTDVARLGEGWIAEEALAIALYAAIRGRDFPDVVRIATNHDGDSDSTASIAGQLHGVRHGITSVPPAWARRLDVLDPLLTLALDLASLSIRGEPTLRTYPPN